MVKKKRKRVETGESFARKRGNGRRVGGKRGNGIFETRTKFDSTGIKEGEGFS